MVTPVLQLLRPLLQDNSGDDNDNDEDGDGNRNTGNGNDNNDAVDNNAS